MSLFEVAILNCYPRASYEIEKTSSMKNLLYVGLTMLAIYLVFDKLLESPPAQILMTQNGLEVTLTANRSGHFVGGGSINGVQTSFLVDTGATVLSVPESMVGSLNLGSYRIPVNQVSLETAAGTVKGYRVIVDRVLFEGIEQRHVAAVVVPKLEKPLLGMNFLRKIEMTQSGKKMTLRAR